MADQALVPKEIQDVLDGKAAQAKPPITSNQRLIEEMQKQAGVSNA